jgi:RNA polymerase sigma-70 factor (ECF subfamily)
MPACEPSPTPASAAAQVFATTRWSVVLAVGSGEDVEVEQALATLCTTYWYPLYVYVRRNGYNPQDAEDLTQSFFANLLEKRGLESVRREKGKFRSFLLASLKNFLANEWDKRKAIKRGGKYSIISWDEGLAESRYLREPLHGLTPERVYEQTWALTVIEKVMTRLRADYANAGRNELFEALHPHLTGTSETEAAGEIGRRFGMKDSAVRMAILRLRRAFACRLREEISQTVSSSQELDEELRHLCHLWSGEEGFAEPESKNPE